MPPDRYGTCEYHLDIEKKMTEVNTKQDGMKELVDELWRRFNNAEKEIQKHEGELRPVERDVEDLKKKVETKSLEDQGYQTMVRNISKTVEELVEKKDEYALKKDVATKESVEDIKKWVRYGWLATVFGILLLLANLALVLVPMIWGRHPG